ISVSFFFFQAEDGIRDRNVTGVQTCALPILYDQAGVHIGHQHIVLKFYANLVFRSPAIHMGKRFMENVANQLCVPPQRQGPVFRSEERRVGKEGRCRWWWWN